MPPEQAGGDLENKIQTHDKQKEEGKWLPSFKRSKTKKRALQGAGELLRTVRSRFSLPHFSKKKEKKIVAHTCLRPILIFTLQCVQFMSITVRFLKKNFKDITVSEFQSCFLFTQTGASAHCVMQVD